VEAGPGRAVHTDELSASGRGHNEQRRCERQSYRRPAGPTVSADVHDLRGSAREFPSAPRFAGRGGGAPNTIMWSLGSLVKQFVHTLSLAFVRTTFIGAKRRID
jgi:hypothetical protein